MLTYPNGCGNLAADVKEAVREFRAAGGFYDDDALRYVADKLDMEPDRELSRACYNAKTYLRDEEALATLNEYRSEGFQLVRDTYVAPDKRYELRKATLYCGRVIPDYSGAVTCRSVKAEKGVFLLPGRNRTHGYQPEGWDLVRKL